MKIGLVVEGRSEFDALPSLAVTLEAATGNQILRPLLAEVTPLAPIGVIARAVAHLVERLEAEDVETVIILMDREQRPECPGVLADRLGDALIVDGSGAVPSRSLSRIGPSRTGSLPTPPH